MPDEATLSDNADRLLKHLRDGSLAARLVHARHTAPPSDPAKAMKAVLQERLRQVRADLDSPKT